MEGFVVRVFEGYVFETLVGGHEAVADYLDLLLMRDCFEVWVQDGFFGASELFAVAVACGGGIEALIELVLGFGG